MSFDRQISVEDLDFVKKAELALFTFPEIVDRGRKGLVSFIVLEPKPDDCFMLCYTSGVTGDPKGVKLTQKMFAIATQNHLSAHADKRIGKDDVHLSYLPLAHVTEQSMLAIAAMVGMQVGFYSGNAQTMLSRDIPQLKPTIFVAVPRYCYEIYHRITKPLTKAGGCAGCLFSKALSAKLRNLEATGAVTHPCYDYLVFNKVKKLLGGRVRMLCTGSAPIPHEVMNVLQVCFSCDIVQGYGLPETSGGCTTTIRDPRVNMKLGQLPPEMMDAAATSHVGSSAANVKIRLRDLPEMGYMSSDDPPTGEVCIWGHQVTKGYFKNEEKTREAFHDDWFLTGDIGQVNSNGSIKIIDRLENIFKLSQGEYIAPEKLENVYLQSEWIMQCWVHGDPLHHFCLLFAVIDPARLEKYMSEESSEYTALTGNKEALMTDPDLKSAVYADILRLADINKFKGFEIPKNIALLTTPFTAEADLLTPTQKLKRSVARHRFMSDV